MRFRALVIDTNTGEPDAKTLYAENKDEAFQKLHASAFPDDLWLVFDDKKWEKLMKSIEAVK